MDMLVTVPILVVSVLIFRFCGSYVDFGLGFEYLVCFRLS